MNLKVLVVDDDFVNRKLILTLLKKHSDMVGTVIEAENGSEALNILKEEGSVDIILLDIMMPVLDGKEFLKIFRSEDSTPVVVLSTDDTQKSTVLNLGADDFILKPIKEEQLMSSIKHWVSA